MIHGGDGRDDLSGREDLYTTWVLMLDALLICSRK